MPGTDTNVTPDRNEPIVAMATRNHGCFLPPRKKPWLSVFLPASQDTVKSSMK